MPLRGPCRGVFLERETASFPPCYKIKAGRTRSILWQAAEHFAGWIEAPAVASTLPFKSYHRRPPSQQHQQQPPAPPQQWEQDPQVRQQEPQKQPPRLLQEHAAHQQVQHKCWCGNGSYPSVGQQQPQPPIRSWDLSAMEAEWVASVAARAQDGDMLPPAPPPRSTRPPCIMPSGKPPQASQRLLLGLAAFTPQPF